MAIVRPFAALRPRPELAARVAAVPYDVVSTDEARALATDALSFLHVSRAEIDLPAGTDPYADAVYAKAASNFEQLKQDALLQESRAALYVYRLRMGSHEQTGVAACFSVDEYRRDLIKKHERTRPEKENDRTRHIVETKAQSGPVLLTYREQDGIERAVARTVAAEPLYDFRAPDDVQHTIWRAEPEIGANIVAGFAQVPALYIADGHHRAASAARAYDYFASRTTPAGALSGSTVSTSAAAVDAAGLPDAAALADAAAHAASTPPIAPEHAWFLAVAFPTTQVQILPYHRVVKDLAGRTPEDFLAALRAIVPVEPLPAAAAAGKTAPGARRKGEAMMYLAGRWYALALDALPAPSAADPIASLDVSRLQDHILAPLLRIGDPRTDTRLDFVGGIRGPAEVARLADSGAAAVAFALFPTTVDDLVTIADAGAIMPPKSTWFEPKLRDGLLTHLIS